MMLMSVVVLLSFIASLSVELSFLPFSLLHVCAVVVFNFGA